MCFAALQGEYGHIAKDKQEEDAEDLIRYLRYVSGETPFLVREPEEIMLTIEQEQEFLREKKESDQELMLIAVADGSMQVTVPS